MVKLYVSLWEMLLHAAILSLIVWFRISGESLKRTLRAESLRDMPMASDVTAAGRHRVERSSPAKGSPEIVGAKAGAFCA